MQRTLNGDAVKAIREAKGISLRALARDIHRDPGHISRAERGISHTSMATIAAIASRLEVSIDAVSHPVVTDAAS